jgi:phage terminase Nu1 subunit (DNA packaging protein)
VKQLREEAAARGGEDAAAARARLGQAQAPLAEAKAAQLGSELVEADAVEKLWSSKLRAFRNRILGIPQRVQYQRTADHGFAARASHRARRISR